MRLRTLPVLALLLATLFAVPVHPAHKGWAQAADAPQDFAPRQLAEQRISMEQAIAIVQRQTGGKVLDARAQGQQYRIKILTRGGEVRIVHVDAATGTLK